MHHIRIRSDTQRLRNSELLTQRFCVGVWGYWARVRPLCSYRTAVEGERSKNQPGKLRPGTHGSGGNEGAPASGSDTDRTKTQINHEENKESVRGGAGGGIADPAGNEQNSRIIETLREVWETLPGACTAFSEAWLLP